MYGRSVWRLGPTPIKSLSKVLWERGAHSSTCQLHLESMLSLCCKKLNLYVCVGVVCLWYWDLNSGFWLGELSPILNHVSNPFCYAYVGNRVLLFSQPGLHEILLILGFLLLLEWQHTLLSPAVFLLRLGLTDFFAWSGLEPRSSWSQSPKWLGLQAWTTHILGFFNLTRSRSYTHTQVTRVTGENADVPSSTSPT
jgi:hypothetical protein